METQQLVEGEELREFVRAEHALARDERIRIREEKKEDEARIAAMEEAERIRQHKKEDEERIAAMEEAERIRQHEKEVLRIQVEADRIRLQETSMSREMNDSANRPQDSGRSPKLPVFSEANDDMDAYLQRSERYAENEGCDADCYGTYLGSLLSGKAFEFYSRLPASEACDCYKLKPNFIEYPAIHTDYS